MSEHTKTVQVEVNGVSFDADCKYEFEAGEEAVLHLLPENCSPGYEAEITPFELHVHFDVTKKPVDMSFLLESSDILEDIADQVNDEIESSQDLD